MNKLIAKTVKKSPLVVTILAILFALSIVITAIFGVNYAATANDAKTVTVTMNSFLYKTEAELDKIENACEAEFKKQGLQIAYEQQGAMSGDDCEILFVFQAKTDAAKLNKAVENLNATFENTWKDFQVSARSATEKLPVKMSASNYVRTAIAVTLFAVLAFAFVAIRYRLHSGIFAAILVLVGAVETASIILLTRIPLTTVTLSAIAISALVTAIFTMLYLDKIRANTKSNAYESDEALTVESVPVCNILTYTAVLGGALILVGAIATPSTRWFALCALIAVVVAAAVALFFAPALYLPLKAKADETAAARAKGYKGAKSTKMAKAAAQETPVVVAQDSETEVAND